MKPQTIRLLDVFVIGPAMVYTASKATKVHPAMRWFVGLAGVGTVLYNGFNYLEQLENSTGREST